MAGEGGLEGGILRLLPYQLAINGLHCIAVAQRLVGLQLQQVKRNIAGLSLDRLVQNVQRGFEFPPVQVHSCLDQDRVTVAGRNLERLCRRAQGGIVVTENCLNRGQ